MIRKISPHTLKYVFAASFLCGFLYDLIGLPFTGAFAAAALIRTAYEKRLIDVCFRIVITSVYCICPGLTMANLFDGILRMDQAVILSKGLQLIQVGGGIAAGILACGFLCGRIFRHSVKEN